MTLAKWVAFSRVESGSNNDKVGSKALGDWHEHLEMEGIGQIRGLGGGWAGLTAGKERNRGKLTAVVTVAGHFGASAVHRQKPAGYRVEWGGRCGQCVV